MTKYISMSAICLMFYMIGNVTAEFSKIQREYIFNFNFVLRQITD